MEYVVGLKKRRQAVSIERKHHKPPLCNGNLHLSWEIPKGMEYVVGLKKRRQVEVPFGNGVCGGFKIAAASSVY